MAPEVSETGSAVAAAVPDIVPVLTTACLVVKHLATVDAKQQQRPVDVEQVEAGAKDRVSLSHHMQVAIPRQTP